MDWLNKWFVETSESTAGSILLFILVFLSRVAIDQWTQRRAAKRQRRKKTA